MRGKLAIILLMMTLLFSGGCGEENDCVTCPPIPVIDKLAVTGLALLRGHNLTFDCEIVSLEGETLPEVDSVTVAGRLVDIQPWYLPVYPAVYGHVYFSDPSLSSGAVIDVIVYCAQDSGVCQVTLLDFYDDAVEFPEYDTVELNTPFVVSWLSVVNADAYTYEITHAYDSAGYRVNEYTGYQADTSMSMSAQENGFDGIWTVEVAAVSEPDTSGWTGGFQGSEVITGNVICRTGLVKVEIFVGTGDPDPSAPDKL